MAAVVNHGSLAPHSSQMHPFFRPAQGIKPGSAASNEAHSDDTSTDMSTHSNPQPVSDGHSSPLSFNSRFTPRDRGRQESQAGQETEIDPNSDRRKRRKITPLAQNDGGDNIEPRESNETTEAWRQQLEAAASSVTTFTSPATFDSTRGSDSARPLPSARAPRRSGRITVSNELHAGKIASAPDPTRARASHPPDDLPDQQPHPEKTTPKKKMLKLTNKGKLLKSPTPSPNAEKSNKTASRKPGQIVLQQGRIVPCQKIAIPYRHSKGGQAQTAEKIDQILGGHARAATSNRKVDPAKGRTENAAMISKPTHPFFMVKGAGNGRQSPARSATGEHSTRETSTESSTTHVKPPVPWNEIKLGMSRLSNAKDAGSQQPLWPPLSFQHLHPPNLTADPQPHPPQTAQTSKQKREITHIAEEEDVLASYAYQPSTTPDQVYNVQLPGRLYLDSKQILDLLDRNRPIDAFLNDSQAALHNMRSRVLTSRSAFDRGTAAGPQDWVHAYSPQRSEDVLQPESRSLRDWLTKLKVHLVQSKISSRNEQAHAKRAARKRKPKRVDDLDDFIASSDDEITTKSTSVKNMMVICGPPGCGKTAAVYAVAQELDFEVFEIHPGMRRSAKDIFDKVGDMAHNHLVQPLTALSRDSSTLTEELDHASVEEDIVSGKQSTMASFVGIRKLPPIQHPATQSEKMSLQKQSLILFEEVDILFEEDKSFWTGVQTLMQHAKRPIVLTCNSIESVPMDELNIHATLFFDRPSVPEAVDYLTYVAAAEGHILQRPHVEALFLGRGQDLRASLTQLNFWCQMTVGSKLGGLDWMRLARSPQSEESRIVSKGTFYHGLDLIPEKSLSAEDLLVFAKDSLYLATTEWEAAQDTISTAAGQGHKNRLKGIRDSQYLAETISCMDVLDASTTPLLSSVASEAFPGIRQQANRDGIVEALLKRPSFPPLSRWELRGVFEPIMDDYRTFPPTTGRGAASLDGAAQTVATEVAPYVRSIVAFDQRLEEHRSELDGASQNPRQRKTRAARAALEGGDKANTRRERWFPKELNFHRVLHTGCFSSLAKGQGLDFGGDTSRRPSQDSLSNDDTALATLEEPDEMMQINHDADLDEVHRS